MIKREIVVPTIAVVVLVVVAVSAAVYFGVIQLLSSSTPESSARYYPSDVMVYSWMTMNPGEGQLRHMVDLFRRFNELSEFRDAYDDVLDEVESEVGIDFKDDVATWIGSDLSAALIDFDLNDESIDIAATIGVRDSEAAARFLDDWLDYIEDTHGADFDRDSEGDFDIWEDESVYQAYALSGDLLVFATTRNSLDDVLARAGGDTDRTLASMEDFQQARAALPDRRFVSVYVDVEETADALLDEFAYSVGFELTDPLDACDGLLGDTPRWVAASAGWVERGVVLDFVSPKVVSAWPEAPDLADAARLLPDDTMGFFSVSFDPVLDHYRDVLDTCNLSELTQDYSGGMEDIEEEAIMGLGLNLDENSTLADVLDAGLDEIDRQIGIDLEKDFFDHLGGQFIMSVGKIRFQDVADNPEDNPIDAVVMLSYQDGGAEDIRDTIEDLIDEIEANLGAEFDDVDMGADQDAYVFDIEGTAYSPGYVLRRLRHLRHHGRRFGDHSSAAERR